MQKVFIIRADLNKKEVSMENLPTLLYFQTYTVCTLTVNLISGEGKKDLKMISQITGGSFWHCSNSLLLTYRLYFLQHLLFQPCHLFPLMKRCMYAAWAKVLFIWNWILRIVALGSRCLANIKNYQIQCNSMKFSYFSELYFFPCLSQNLVTVWNVAMTMPPKTTVICCCLFVFILENQTLQPSLFSFCHLWAGVGHNFLFPFAIMVQWSASYMFISTAKLVSFQALYLAIVVALGLYIAEVRNLLPCLLGGKLHTYR